MNDTLILICERLAQLQPEHIDIQDESALHAGHAEAELGGHYRLTIICTKFNSLNRVERQRLIYNALGELMQTHIHALAIRALSPEEM